MLPESSVPRTVDGWGSCSVGAAVVTGGVVLPAGGGVVAGWVGAGLVGAPPVGGGLCDDDQVGVTVGLECDVGPSVVVAGEVTVAVGELVTVGWVGAPPSDGGGGVVATIK